MLNYEPLFVPQFKSGGNDLNNLKSTLSKNACIVISQVVAYDCSSGVEDFKTVSQRFQC